MQELLTPDRPAVAFLRVAPRTLRIIRTIRTSPIARMIRAMPLIMRNLELHLDTAPHIVIGAGIAGDIGVGPDADLFHVANRNSSAEVKSPSTCLLGKCSTTFPSGELRKGSI